MFEMCPQTTGGKSTRGEVETDKESKRKKNQLGAFRLQREPQAMSRNV